MTQIQVWENGYQIGYADLLEPPAARNEPLHYRAHYTSGGQDRRMDFYSDPDGLFGDQRAVNWIREQHLAEYGNERLPTETEERRKAVGK